MELFQRLVAEARSDVADVSPGLLFPHPKRESSEIRACPPGSGKSDDDDLLTFRGLDFQPVVGAAAGSISAIGTLRHDPLTAIALCFLEELPARCLAVTAERYQPVVRQDKPVPKTDELRYGGPHHHCHRCALQLGGRNPRQF